MLLDSLERFILGKEWNQNLKIYWSLMNNFLVYKNYHNLSKKTYLPRTFFIPLKKESCRFEFFFLSFPSRSDNGAINSIKRKLHISHTYTQSGRSSYSDHRLCTPVAQSSRTITTQMRAVAVVGLWHISNIYFSVSWFEKPCTKW